MEICQLEKLKVCFENEVEDVWIVFQEIANAMGYKAAIVEASEKPSLVTRRASWEWKKGNDERWHAPDPNDRTLVPKDRTLYKVRGNCEFKSKAKSGI